MLSLSPAKLLVILVVALIVLGPEKLPQVARQLGAAWHDLRQLRSRVENEVRGTFPNLPPVNEVAQAVRSPFAFLDRLADEHERAAGSSDDAGGDAATPARPGAGPGGGAGPPGAPAAGDGAGRAPGAFPGSAAASGAGANGAANGAAATGAATSGVPSARGAGSEHGVVSGDGGSGSGEGTAGTGAPGTFPGAFDDPSMN